MASYVAEQTLLQGAWHALEHAAQLVDCAVMLIDAEKFGIARGVAMLGGEELGRYKILRRLADGVAKGRVMSVEEVQAECEDHEEKQRAATLSTTMRTQHGTRLDDALRTQMHETPGSDAWRDADEVLAAAIDAKIKRTPADRHRLRIKSLYVDIQPNGVSWNRPRECTLQEALYEVTNAVNDYAAQRDRLINFPGDPEMATALNTMNPRPDLLVPRWPCFKPI